MEKRIYELTVLCNQDKTSKEVESMVGEWLKKSGGKVMKFDFWGKKELVYPIKKQKQAVYGYFEIEMDTTQLVDLKKRIMIEESLLRHLIVVAKKVKIINKKEK